MKKRQTRVYMAQMRERYEAEEKAGTLNPQWAAKVREIFATYGAGLKECRVADWVPGDNRPPEQKQGTVAGGVGWCDAAQAGTGGVPVGDGRDARAPHSAAAAQGGIKVNQSCF